MKKLSALILLSFSFSNLFAQAGVLDSTFGGDGTQTLSFFNGNYDGARGIAVQPDGKIVASGVTSNATSSYVALTRYNQDGSIDNTFGLNGKTTTNDGEGTGLAIQSDGKIVVAGSYRIGVKYYLAVFRYLSSGDIDVNFGSIGKALFDFGGIYQKAKSVSVQPDGGIVAAGYETDSSGNSDIAIVRCNSSGNPDPNFGIDGKVRTDLGSFFDIANSIAILPDGKIILVADSDMYGSSSAAIIRYNSDGTVDNTFNSDGIVTIRPNGLENGANGIALQSNGKFVIAGYSIPYYWSGFSILRFNADGSNDISFGDNGYVETQFGNFGSSASSVVIQPDGKIIASGDLNQPGNYGEFALVRLDADGTLDNSFGDEGKVTTSFGGASFSNAAALQPDGKIVLAGVYDNAQDYDLAVARYITGLNIGISSFSSQSSSPLLYPNPIQSTEVLQYTLTKDEVLSLDLYDINGTLINNFFSQEKRIAGEHKEELHFENLPAGNYLLTLSNGKGSESVKLIKQ